MSPEKQRIAIAEHCGWVWYRIPIATTSGKVYRCLFHPSTHETPYQNPRWMVRADGSETICNEEYMRTEGLVPDYINDWNAMREAVNGLDEHHRLVFLDRLSEITVNKPGNSMKWFPARIMEATLADYAKAFLRAIAKWEES